jgi:hypothetical protein
MGKVFAVVFALVALAAVFGVKAYLPHLRGADVAQTESEPSAPIKPAVGFKPIGARALSGTCASNAGTKFCKVGG